MMTAHALTFGLLSATSKVVSGESKGWSQVVRVNGNVSLCFTFGCAYRILGQCTIVRSSRGCCQHGGSHDFGSEQDFKSDSTEAADANTPIGGYVLKAAFQRRE